MLSPFPYSPVIRECSWKKTQIEKKIASAALLGASQIYTKIFWSVSENYPHDCLKLFLFPFTSLIMIEVSQNSNFFVWKGSSMRKTPPTSVESFPTFFIKPNMKNSICENVLLISSVFSVHRKISLHAMNKYA